LYTWRVLSRLGPYGRLEAETNLLPKYAHSVNDTAHYFALADADTTLLHIDSVRNAVRIQPSFSPLSVEAGIGAHANLVNHRYVEGRLLAGFGFKKTWNWDQSEIVDSLALPADSAQWSEAERRFMRSGNTKTIIRRMQDNATSPEYGPEASLFGLLRLGRYATAESEFKFFAPIKRIIVNRRFNPDLRWRATMSWRFVRMATLDYQYEYEIREPLGDESLKINTSKHRVLLRFSITSR
jgi:hypothetical protein